MLADPKLLYHGEKTLRSQGLVIAGPMTLRHCLDHYKCHQTVEKALVLRYPVYMENHTMVLPTTGEVVQRWGFVVATIDWKELILQSGMYHRFQHLGREFLLTRKERLYKQQAETTVLAQSPGFQTSTGPGQRTVALTVATNISQWHITVQYPNRESSLRGGIFSITIVLSLIVAGLVFTVLTQKQDMIARTRSQQASIETERKMTSYFAHELRNPVSAIESALIAMPSNTSKEVQEIHQGMLHTR